MKDYWAIGSGAEGSIDGPLAEIKDKKKFSNIKGILLLIFFHVYLEEEAEIDSCYERVVVDEIAWAAG